MAQVALRTGRVTARRTLETWESSIFEQLFPLATPAAVRQVLDVLLSATPRLDPLQDVLDLIHRLVRQISVDGGNARLDAADEGLDLVPGPSAGKEQANATNVGIAQLLLQAGDGRNDAHQGSSSGDEDASSRSGDVVCDHGLSLAKLSQVLDGDLSHNAVLSRGVTGPFTLYSSHPRSPAP